MFEMSSSSSCRGSGRWLWLSRRWWRALGIANLSRHTQPETIKNNLIIKMTKLMIIKMMKMIKIFVMINIMYKIYFKS